jgi:hypothetical protein
MISGNSVILQVGKESSYSTPGTMERQIRFASEGFAPVYNKTQEPVMTGGKGQGRFETMGIKTEGSSSFMARPDDVGLFLKYALGLETIESVEIDSTDTGAVKHTFTPIGNGLNDSIGSLTFQLDKKTTVFVYTGCKINSISLNAAPEDYLQVELDIVGKNELTDGTMNTSLSPSPLKSFKFNQGKVYINNTEVAHITNIGFTYNNNFETDIQTTSTGLGYLEPQANTREISLDLEMIYDTAAETFRQSYLKTDDIFSVKLEFISDEEIVVGVPYSLTIDIPACQVTECSNAVGDANGIRQSVTAAGIEPNDSNTELLTIELVNGFDDEY